MNETGKTPYDMFVEYNKWNTELYEDPSTSVGLQMTWRNWYELEEIQKIVDEQQNATLIEIFTKEAPSTLIFLELTK